MWQISWHEIEVIAPAVYSMCRSFRFLLSLPLHKNVRKLRFWEMSHYTVRCMKRELKTSRSKQNVNISSVSRKWKLNCYFTGWRQSLIQKNYEMSFHCTVIFKYIQTMKTQLGTKKNFIRDDKRIIVSYINNWSFSWDLISSHIISILLQKKIIIFHFCLTFFRILDLKFWHFFINFRIMRHLFLIIFIYRSILIYFSASVTSWSEPIRQGTCSCRSWGITSRIFPEPVDALPPACR